MLKITWKAWFNAEPAIRRIEQGGEEAARLCAEYVAERARVYCPVDTGRLKASIAVTSSMNGTKWHVVATAPWARFVEYGSMHGGRFIAPNPFLRRALADGRRRFPELLKQVGPLAAAGRHLGASFEA